MIDWLHPSVLLMLGMLPLIWLHGRLRQIWQIALPTFLLMAITTMGTGTSVNLEVIGLELTPLRVDKLSLVFAYIIGLILIIGNIFALQVEDRAQHIAAGLYGASALGVVLAGDLVTLYVFWEIMMIASVWLIWRRKTPVAYEAGMRYLLFHALGGMLLFVGVIGYYLATGSVAFDKIDVDGWAFWLILIAFLINAAVPPLHAWLPDAYPEATVTGTVFLSALTTKTAVYTLMRGYPGLEILVWLGVAMALYGVVYATLMNDIRRLLCYHIISQVGYMVAGVGMGTALALNGTAAHAFTHILYKGLLLMGAGAVLQMTGRSRMSDLGGLYRYMPVTFVLYMVGALSISAFPLFSGFVSKTMIVEAAAVDYRGVVYLLMLVAACGTFLHTGLKLPYFTFFGKDSGLRPKEAPINMHIAMGIAAALCFLIGIFPGMLYAILPFPVDYNAYTLGHLLKELQLLFFVGLGFVVAIKYAASKDSIALDVDWLYRGPGRRLVVHTRDMIAEANHDVRAEFMRFLAKLQARLGKAHLDGSLLRTWATGSMALWTALVLALVLVLTLGT